MQDKIRKVLEKSKEVILDCSLENGAIIAANSDLSIYPKDCQNYRYVWPRDASFILVAADILNIKGIHDNFYNWLMDRAEELNESGIIFQNYYPNGPKRWIGFQPDQNGSVLWSIYEHYKGNLDKALKIKGLITKLAEGICNVWDKDHFTIITQDLWEENYTFPKLKNNHTYSLAACSHGLRCANEIIKNDRWSEVSKDMKKMIDDSYDNYFYRTSGKLNDLLIDSSMLGLVYPFNIYSSKDKRIINTIKMIENTNVKNNLVYRYEKDMYDSFRYSGIDARRGSGSWPLLNFWMSIYYSIKKERRKALDYYLTVLDLIEDYFPEQIFNNEIQQSPMPLAWSHAMFVISSRYLGFV